MLRRLLLQSILAFSILFSTFAHAETYFTNRADVQAFIQMMVQKHGFKKQDLEKLFSEVKVRPQVMKSINKPLEKASWKGYKSVFITKGHIEGGVKFWHQYASALHRAEQTYGVPASIIVSTIGVETKYGKNKGEYRVIDALSNIAFSNSTRSKFFKSELVEFLLLAREQKTDPLKILGSYAGAIGQPQFMPSSYRYYAVNFSKSGKTDLVNNEVDVIGSIANYYKKHGWTTHGLVAMPANFTAGYNEEKRARTLNKSLALSQLAKYGIVPSEPIEDQHMKAKIIELRSKDSREYWLVFHNFDVIKRYNPSDLYAMAVYQLSAAIATAKGH